ncbi:MAG: LLM class flavin-dependent oxidoreductase [Streptosporangiales bacterium]|nr:LLM class flavin-dependent oxidoreductase [Streptosporangiales bacterium]
MRFSFVMLPDYPLDDTIESIKLADELGYYGCYAADETWHKDLWLLFAAAADKTSTIRFGPSLSAVTLREPSLIAQATATLDELTGGRAECVLGSGNFGLLAQYGIDWAKTKPLSRLKEAHHAVRTLLDEGAITSEGEFYRYSGLFTFARPVQERVPVKLGAMRGPKSFQLAGEISDGVHHALSYSRRAYEYMVENVRIGAERAGRDADSLDLGAWVVFATGADSKAAKDAARAMVGLYASAMPKEQLERNDVDPAELTDIVAAVGAGRVDQAFELTSPELADRLSIAGTPEECVEKINAQIAGTGVNHMILAITDAALVKAFSGMDLPGVATMREQLQLVHDKVMPAVRD